MASKLPPLPVGMPPGHSYWNDWYEKLRTLVNNSLVGLVNITGGSISGISPPIPIASGGTGRATGTHSVTTFTAVTSVTVTHNLGKFPIVAILDNTNAVMIPYKIEHSSVNAFTVTFSVSTTGTVIAIVGY